MSKMYQCLAVVTTIALVTPSLAQVSLLRVTNPQDGTPEVEMRTGDMRVFFSSRWGGIPLRWFLGANTTSVVYPFVGAGMNVVYETGQDSTQGSANGIVPNPIARIGDPHSIALYNYYIREHVFQPPNGTNPNATYAIRGFAPFFWASFDPIDDAMVGGLASGWFTTYTCNQSVFNNCARPLPCHIPGANHNPFDTEVPVWFIKTPGGPHNGALFIGNEITSSANPGLPWNQRLAEISGGRFAFKVRISLLNAAPTAFASILFRKQIPPTANAGINEAFVSPGYMLNVNRRGIVELLKINPGGSQQCLLGYDDPANPNDNNRCSLKLPPSVLSLVQPLVTGSNGVLLELRTFNFENDRGRMDLYIENQFIATVRDSSPILGTHFGFYAFTPDDCTRIKFWDRQFFDVGIEFRAKYTARPDGFIESDVTVLNTPGVPASVTHAFWPSGLPKTFFNNVANVGGPNDLDTIRALDRCGNLATRFHDLLVCNGTICTNCQGQQGEIRGTGVITPLVLGGAQSAFTSWLGNNSGTFGLYTTPMLATINGVQAVGPYVFQCVHPAPGPMTEAGTPFNTVSRTCPAKAVSSQRFVALWGRSIPPVSNLTDCNNNGIPDECELDTDGDGVIDACDGCPFDPNKIIPGICGCGIPDTDTDGDGTPDCNDACPFDPNKVVPGQCGCGNPDTDTDGDGIADCVDNCLTLPNPGQEDCQSNGIGDVCDIAASTSTDCNTNSIPDECEAGVSLDIPRFIGVLLGTNANSVDVCLADLNGDGAVNGLDIQAFVNTLLGL